MYPQPGPSRASAAGHTAHHRCVPSLQAALLRQGARRLRLRAVRARADRRGRDGRRVRRRASAAAAGARSAVGGRERVARKLASAGAQRTSARGGATRDATRAARRHARLRTPKAEASPSRAAARGVCECVRARTHPRAPTHTRVRVRAHAPSDARTRWRTFASGGTRRAHASTTSLRSTTTSASMPRSR